MPAAEKTVYGRCRAAPEVSEAESGRVVRFDLIQADTGQVIAVLAWPSATAALPEWIADLTAAPLIRVTGRFRLHRPGPVGQRVWQILASSIEIGPRDSGADLIAAPKAYALARASHPEMCTPERTERTLEVGRAILKPMQRHRGGFALAFQAYSTADALIDVIYPVADDAESGDLVALSGALSRASRITLTGYFRPSVVRGDQVMRWGFVASACEILGDPPRRAVPVPPKRTSSPRKPRPAEPTVQVSLPKGTPLLEITRAERALLETLPLSAVRMQIPIRQAVKKLGCKTLAEVADLSIEHLGWHRSSGHRHRVLCRRALQDRLAQGALHPANATQA